MSKKKTPYETPRILHDAPLADSHKAYFYFDQFAITIARLIANMDTRTPITIGISGPWGSGKTSLLRRVQRLLNQTRNLQSPNKAANLDFANEDENPQDLYRVCKTVWFPAWKYAGEDELLIALVRVIVQTMYQDDFVSKGAAAIFDPFKDRRDVIDTVLSWFSIKTPFGEVGLNTGKPLKTSFAENIAMLDLFDDALDRLIAAWVYHSSDVKKELDPRKGAVVIFIDDLDRCLPAKTVQVLEAIKLFLDKPGCIFVIGAQIDVVQEAVAQHYHDIGVVGKNANDYLDKVIQLHFELPPILTETMREYLATEKIDIELQNHWQALVEGAEVNPRKVKAFVNDLNLQWAILKNIGQAKGVDRDDFTRWQVLIRSAPESFKTRVRLFNDDNIRYNFIAQALRWASGDESLNASFQDYSGFPRLQRVLGTIRSFSDGFTPEVLNAFVHLIAPPRSLLRPKGEDIVESTLEQFNKTRVVSQGSADLVETHIVALPMPKTEWFGPIEVISVPDGKFIMGSRDDDLLASDNERPLHTCEVPYAYYISRFPITCRLYGEFVKLARYDYQWPKELDNRPEHPVGNVSWMDAMSYCRWLTETQHGVLPRGYQFRLPTEAEWEKAARGDYGNEWPWGNEFDAGKCNSLEGHINGTTPVGQFSRKGDSPCGASDAVGNVWEWTHSAYKKYPYIANDGREQDDSSAGRVLRGGSFRSNHKRVRTAFRFVEHPAIAQSDYGFRIALAPIHANGFG